MNLSGWVTQAEEQAEEGELPVVIHKRVGKASVAEHYVTMSGAAFTQLVELLDDTRPEFTKLDLRRLLEVIEPRMIDQLGGLLPEPAEEALDEQDASYEAGTEEE